MVMGVGILNMSTDEMYVCVVGFIKVILLVI